MVTSFCVRTLQSHLYLQTGGVYASGCSTSARCVVIGTGNHMLSNLFCATTASGLKRHLRGIHNYQATYSHYTSQLFLVTQTSSCVYLCPVCFLPTTYSDLGLHMTRTHCDYSGYGLWLMLFTRTVASTRAQAASNTVHRTGAHHGNESRAVGDGLNDDDGQGENEEGESEEGESEGGEIEKRENAHGSSWSEAINWRKYWKRKSLMYSM